MIKDDLEFLISRLHFPTVGITGICHHAQYIQCKASDMLGKHSTYWVTCQPLLQAY